MRPQFGCEVGYDLGSRSVDGIVICLKIRQREVQQLQFLPLRVGGRHLAVQPACVSLRHTLKAFTALRRILNVRSYFDRIGLGAVALGDGTACLDTGSEFEFSGNEEEESVPVDWRTD